MKQSLRRMSRRALGQGIACGLSARLVHGFNPDQSAGWATVETTLIDAEATPFGTFQSHNQNIVHNEHGIFLTYIRSRNESYTAQQWRLMRSRNEGQTFTVAYEATDTTSAPAIETDADGNLYLYRPNWVSGRGYLYRFLAADEYRTPRITEFDLPLASGKYCLALDRERGLLYVAQNPFWLAVLSTDGRLQSKTKLWSRGARASLEYPQLNVAADGTVHLAWTTNVHGEYWYWSIHHMVSRDAGLHWHRMNGVPLKPPIQPDDPAAAQQISRRQQNQDHTWLANFIATRDRVHFVYATVDRESSDLKSMNYLRYDTATGQSDVQHTPEFRGQQVKLNKSSGFFCSGGEALPLFCVMADDNRIACLASRDLGQTWTDYARGQTSYPGAYAISGCRTTSSGYILGSFTDRRQQRGDPLRQSAVYFFRIKATNRIG